MSFPNSIAGNYGWEKEETSSQKHPLGTLMTFPDGRKFRYTHNGGTAIGEGLLAASPALVAHHGSDGDLAVATTAAGSTTISVTLEGTAAAKDLFAEGYLWFNAAGTSVHEFYKIKSHPAIDSSSAGTITLDEESGLHQAVTNGTDTAGLMRNPYKDAIVATAALNERPIGVTVNNFTADYYGWVQTAGLSVAKIDGTPALNAPLGPSSNHAGQLLVAGADTTGGIARIVSLAGVDNEYAPVFLYNME